MDKLKLSTEHKMSVPRHVRERFRCTGVDHLPNGLRVFHYVDDQTGVRLTDSPQHLSLTLNPTKYLKGSNYSQIDREELGRCIDHLSERYATELREWNVSLFDFNVDVPTDFPPSSYFPLFGHLTKSNRTVFIKGTGVQYTNSSNTKALTMYDLHRRCDKDGTPHAEGYRLRLEFSGNSKLHQIKHLQHMKTMNDYLQPDNYNQLPELLLATYNAIEKEEPVFYVPGLRKREGDMLSAIQLEGLNRYRDKLRRDYPKQYSYHAKRITELLNKVRKFQQRRVELSLIAELNRKVSERVRILQQQTECLAAAA